MYPDAKDEVVQLHLDDIIPNRFQPREVFDEKALKELAVSIKEHGVIQPIIVRNVNGKYEIIAGERRYKASALAGLTKIPAIIRDLDDKESSKVALLENLQRKNLSPIEEARTYQKILEIDEMTQEELAKTMGKSQSAVANKIRLLSLPDEVQDALLKEQISERHARTLLNVPDQKKQKEMLKKVIDTKMSVRSLEEEINKLYPKDNEEKDKKIEPTAISNTFINNSPLTPTAEMPVDESNYGKVTIAPPDEGNSEEEQHKFINFGEIKKAEQEEENKNTFTEKNEVQKIDITSITENAENINNNDIGNAALDSLLSFGNPSVPNTKADNNGFITPAEKIVKNDEQLANTSVDESSDYFKTPDLVSLQLPQAVINPNVQNTGTASSESNYTVEEAMDKIRKLTDELRTHGIKINTDEMNFDKNYQIIIKIDKS